MSFHAVARMQNYGKTELSRQTELTGKDLLLNVSFGQVVMIVKTYFPHRHSLGIFRKAHDFPFKSVVVVFRRRADDSPR